MSELIRLEALGFSRGPNEVLRGVTFSLGTGEKVGLVGANGAGKTTLLGVVAGSLAPTDGRVVRQPGVRVAGLVERAETWRGTVWEVAEAGLEQVRRLEATLRERRLPLRRVRAARGSASGRSRQSELRDQPAEHVELRLRSDSLSDRPPGSAELDLQHQLIRRDGRAVVRGPAV